MRGGISAAEVDSLKYWGAFPGLKEKLLHAVRPGYFELSAAPEDVFSTILSDASVQNVKNQVMNTLSEWEDFARDQLTEPGDNAKRLVNTLSIKMRDMYADNSVINKYDSYGIYTNYAIETMQDDLFVICADGWGAGRDLDRRFDKKTKKEKSWDGLILPKELIKQEYFSSQLASVQDLTAKSEQLDSEIEQFIQECADMGEDDPLSEVRNEDKMSSDADCKKQLKTPGVSQEERDAINKYLKLRADLSAVNKQLKAESVALEQAARDKYNDLSDTEIADLAINKKWLPAIRAGINAMWENIVQSFANSVVALHERYQDTLPSLEQAVAASQAEVHGILKELGFEWGDK